MEPAKPADLTDALALGRLTLAELATLSGEELDALHAVAVARLDTGRHDDARTLLAALVTLFPFRARFWRAYGVALQRCGHLQHAIAAYDAALTLDPEHGLTLCHRAEATFLLGEQEVSAKTIFRLIDHPASDVAERAAALWHVIAQTRRPAVPFAPEPSDNAPVTAELSVPSEPDAFTLTDGRALPLEESRFESVVEETEPVVEIADDVPREITQSVYRTNTGTVTPLPEGTGGAGGRGTKTESTVITAVERRVHGWPLTEDEITLTASGPLEPKP